MEKTNGSITASCWRLQCRVLVLALAAVANGVQVEALRTVLDPNGLPLLQPARTSSAGPGGLHDDGSCKDTTTTRGWGGLRRVDLIYLGSFAVQQSSTAIKRQPTLAPSRSTNDVHLQEGLAEALLETPGGKSDGGKAAPLLLLGEHVCALSMEKKEKQLDSAGGFTLREPYAWESDLDVAGFVLPRWMWDAVGGETGGGALLIHPNISSPKEQGAAPGRRARGPSRAHAVNFSEPFVQVALWGDGKFHPLLRATSSGLSLEGGPGGVEKGGGNRKAIRTEEGDLEISPAAGLHLLSGTEQGSDVRIGTRGKRGGVYLNSDVLHWTSSSSFVNSSGTFSADESSTTGVGLDLPARNRGEREGVVVGEGVRQGTAAEHKEASFRIDEDALEARGLTAVKLSAGRSFYLNVVGWPEGGGAGEPNGGAVRGDLESVNASAGVVNVQALDRVLVSGANRARVTSATGEVCLDASDGTSSLRLSSADIQGAAPTITFSAGAVPESGTRAAGGSLGTTTGPSGEEDLRVLGIVGGAAGGYLNLTGKSAVIGGPGDASVEAGDEVRLRANISVLCVSTATVAIQSPTVLLQAPPLRESAPTIEVRPPPGKQPSSPSTSHEVGALLSLTGGVLAMNASASIEWETPGALARLVGRRDSRSHEDVPASERVGMFVADADVVEIRARSPAGVIITADGEGAGDMADDVETAGKNAEKSTTGARLEVSAEGVSMDGISTSVGASRRLTLRAGGEEGSTDQTGSPRELKGENGHTWSTAQPGGRGVSTVELGDGGIKVIAPSSQSVSLRAGAGIVLEAPQLAISHSLEGGSLSEEKPGDDRRHKTSDGKVGGGDGVRGGGGGGGGLWSDGASLTGRADRRVLLQAGPSNGGKSKGDETGTSRSHISIEEDRIRMCVGGARELAPAAPRVEPAASATGDSGGGAAFPRKGLSLEVVGMASLSSTKDLELRAQEVLVSSSNQTIVHSPGGLLLTGSPALSSVAADNSKLDAGRAGLRQQGGQILLAPGVGAGVAIGPAFSSRDLLAPIGSVPSLLYVTNATHPASQRLRPSPDAHIAVESSGNSAVAVLSPRGAESAVRFGCAGLPYSGGLAVRHHLDTRAGDTLLLELASSPGRIVGDASGRWGVGAASESAGLAATLHVFAVPKLAESSGAGVTSAKVPEPATAFLIESAGAGVMQLLSGTASSPQTSIANAIVLTSRPGGNEPKGHNHWVMSQLGDKSTASRPPAWTDASADRSSWAGGMTLTHVSGGGSTGWRSALETSPPAGDANSEKIAKARPHLALSSDGGRSGFGTGPTGARVTVGGALMAEQVLILSDEGVVRDVDELGNQGREQAMEALRQIDVVSFGWTKEASASYGLRSDVRQVGVIAQEVEKKVSPSLVWEDATTGRKAVSYSRLLVTLVAAFQHLDSSVNGERKTWDSRLEGLEKGAVLAAESARNASDRLRVVEAATEAGVEASTVHTRDLVALEGRLLEQVGQVQAAGTDLAALQRKTAEEKGDIQEWRLEGSRREQELEREVAALKSRLTIMEERRKDSLADQKVRQKAQDEQIQALSLRIGTSHASQSRCDSSLLAEVEALRTSQGELESRLDPLLRHQQALAHDEEAYFLEEVERLESHILAAELQRGNGHPSAGATTTDADVASNLNGVTRTLLSSPKNGDRSSAGGAPLTTAEIRQTLELHKDRVRVEAAASLLSRREHLKALRQMGL